MRRIIAIFTILIVVGCTRLQETGPVDKTTEKLPSQTIYDGTIDVVKGGRLQYVIKAGRIRSYERERLTLLDSSVVVDFYNQVGKHTSVLTSDQARVEENKNIFQALGDVVVVTDSGDVLRTERLYWDEAKRRIRSDTLVTIVTPTDSLQGYDFEADENLSSMQLRQPTGLTLRKMKP
jgi:LPS export ABC transporter protein LptC